MTDRAGSSVEMVKAGAMVWAKLEELFFGEEVEELEYGEFLELGEAAGLLKTEVYDPEKHGDEILGGPEPGDVIYVPTELAEAMRALAVGTTVGENPHGGI